MKNSSSGFFALFQRQALIKRWSLKRCNFNETVLEHAASVAFLTMCIGEIARDMGKQVNTELMLQSSLIHDLSEALISDVPTPVKYATEALRSEFEKIEIEAERTILKSSPALMLEKFRQAFELDGYEKKLLKSCDIYAAYIKAKCEIESGNTVEFGVAFEQIAKRLEAQKLEVPELAVLDAWFTDSFSKSIDELVRQ